MMYFTPETLLPRESTLAFIKQFAYIYNKKARQTMALQAIKQ